MEVVKLQFMIITKEELKHFNKLQDDIYQDYNPIIVHFKDGEYDYHKNDNPEETGYTDNFIIQNLLNIIN